MSSLIHLRRTPWRTATLLATSVILNGLAFPGARADSTVVFNEIHYHPATDEAELEWVELHNQMAVDMDISNWRLTDGLEFVFAEGTVVEGGGFLVVAAAPLALEAASGFSRALGPFEGRLDNSGERLELRDNNFRLMDSMSYRDRGSWPVAPDGSGLSLAKRRPGDASSPAANWTSSVEMGGTLGRRNFREELSGKPEGVVSYWSFDEEAGNTVFDFFAQQNGTLGRAATRVPGLVGPGALTFDNSADAFVSVRALASDSFSVTEGITIEAVLEPAWSGEVGDEDHILRKEDGPQRIVLAFQHDGTADNRDVPIEPAEQQVLSFGINVGGSYSELDVPLDGQEGRPTLAQLTDGASHHVAATYDTASGLKTVSVDGVVILSAAFPEGSPIQSGGASTAYIGNMAGRGHPFTGVIDEVAFWERALSAEEIASHAADVRAGRDYFEVDPGVDPEESRLSLAFNETQIAGGDSWVELVNHGPGDLPIGGFVVHSSRGTGEEYVLPDRSLTSGAYLTLAPDELGFDLGIDDKLFLYPPDRAGVVDAVLLEAGLRGRHPEGTGRWLFPDMPTPGSENSFVFHDEIVINEILYHPRPVLERQAVFEHVVMIPVESEWTFDQSGSDLGTAWREPGFGDANWPRGEALFFNETSSLPAAKNTPLELGPITYYFRTEFQLSGDPEATRLAIRLVVDDGAIVYLNGVEVYRLRMPEGDVTASTLASRSTGNARFAGPFDIATDSLAAGRNTLAVEVHQASATSNDVAFGLELLDVKTIVSAQEYEESSEEWLELFNQSDGLVDLSGWRFDNGIRYVLAPGTTLGPGEYLVVTGDVDFLRAKYPEIEARIVGNFEGRLSNRSDRISLVDARGNPADEVRYFDRGHWHEYADGLGSSLELRDPRADNMRAEGWAASEESTKSRWATYSYTGSARPDLGPTQWNEFVFGLFEAGEVLLDDMSVIEAPAGADPEEFLQNGDFESGEAAWRFLGTHGESQVITDPDDPENHVLHLVATGPTEHMHNHVETTYVRPRRVTNGQEYRISFRAKWLAGSNQLHTRLYFNRLARTHIINAPERTGTPGARNSRFEDNLGPTYVDFRHTPLFPAPGDGVTVSVRAVDPDGVKSCTLLWSDDRVDWQSVAMDPVGAGLFQGVIPWSGDRIITFYVEGEDQRGAMTAFPAAGPAGGAHFKGKDGEAPVGEVHTLRILMALDVANFLYENTNRMSNAHLPATLIVNESEVFYGVGVRLRGSERGRPDDSRTSFNVRFQPDQLFRGVHRSISIDRSGGWAGFVPRGAQDEILVKHVANHAGGIPSMYDDIVHVIAPRRTHTSRALLLMARFSSVYLDSQFENGSDGTRFTYELIYHPTTTTDGNPESLKRPLPDNVLGVDHRDLGDDKEIYRWFYLVENNIQRDDFSQLMRFTKALGLPGTQMDAAMREIMDIDQWARAFAFYSLCGIGDTYMSGNLHNNIYYVRPSDGKVLVFPWDMDFAFVNSTSHPVIWNQHNLRRVLELPRNARHYYRHILDIMDTTFNREYMSRWVSHYGALDKVNFSGILNYIVGRESFVRRSIPREVPFAITTNGGEDFAVDEASVTIDGTAWIDVATLVLVERPDLEITWPVVTRWGVTVELEPGANPLSFFGFDAEGNLLDVKTIVVTSTVVPPGETFIRGDANADGQVNITDAVRVLFHIARGMPLGCEEAGDVNNDDSVDVTDAVALLSFLFQRGSPPPAPFPGCGVDASEDNLECAEFGSCPTAP